MFKMVDANKRGSSTFNLQNVLLTHNNITKKIHFTQDFFFKKLCFIHAVRVMVNYGLKKLF